MSVVAFLLSVLKSTALLVPLTIVQWACGSKLETSYSLVPIVYIFYLCVRSVMVPRGSLIKTTLDMLVGQFVVPAFLR